MKSLRFERVLWAMPLAYAIHIPEELLTGFPAWVTKHLHGTMDGPGFLVNNGIFMVILLSLALWASRTKTALPAFVFLCWASGNLFWNFVFHLVTTVIADSYSPGLVSATLLYFPISFLVTAVAVKQKRLGVTAVWGAFAVGACLMLFVIWAGLWHFHAPV